MEIQQPNKKRLRFYSTIITLIGIALRTYHLIGVGSLKPWKFGGLYLEFARQIFQNYYLLPETIPHYTQGGLPFAYPPLPFYIESFFVFNLGLPEFLVVNFLPGPLEFWGIAFTFQALRPLCICFFYYGC